MIKKIKIDNFKSLVDFECDLAKFNCLVGLNGAGKSTLLQAMDFLAQLMVGDLDTWLNQRHWERSDLKSKLSPKLNIYFEIVLQDNYWGEITWSGSVNRSKLNCTQETIRVGERAVMRVHEGSYSIYPPGEPIIKEEIDHFDEIKLVNDIRSEMTLPIVFKYQGSILSQLTDKQITSPLKVLQDELKQLKSLDLLSPTSLRKKSRSSKKDLGLGGERLSAFIHELDVDSRVKLLAHLKELYPALNVFDTSSLRSGWKELWIREEYDGVEVDTEARHINDGFLRVMAIIAQLLSGHTFLLFDEIENGINPELIEILMQLLVEAPQQVMVTTHSPMILNYLEDEVATKGVLLVYKTTKGITRTVPFFEIPSMAKKLAFMGPGEVFVDTDLKALVAQLNQDQTQD